MMDNDDNNNDDEFQDQEEEDGCDEDEDEAQEGKRKSGEEILSKTHNNISSNVFLSSTTRRVPVAKTSKISSQSPHLAPPITNEYCSPRNDSTTSTTTSSTALSIHRIPSRPLHLPPAPNFLSNTSYSSSSSRPTQMPPISERSFGSFYSTPYQI